MRSQEFAMPKYACPCCQKSEQVPTSPIHHIKHNRAIAAAPFLYLTQSNRVRYGKIFPQTCPYRLNISKRNERNTASI